jgi:hypothetical protein
MQEQVLLAVRLLASDTPNLCALDLSTPSLRKIKRQVRGQPTPLRLRLDETSLLAHSLRHTRHLMCLSLANNKLGPEAARVLTDALRPQEEPNGAWSCCLVYHLDVSGNRSVQISRPSFVD